MAPFNRKTLNGNKKNKQQKLSDLCAESLFMVDFFFVAVNWRRNVSQWQKWAINRVEWARTPGGKIQSFFFLLWDGRQEKRQTVYGGGDTVTVVKFLLNFFSLLPFLCWFPLDHSVPSPSHLHSHPLTPLHTQLHQLRWHTSATTIMPFEGDHRRWRRKSGRRRVWTGEKGRVTRGGAKKKMESAFLGHPAQERVGSGKKKRSDAPPPDGKSKHETFCIVLHQTTKKAGPRLKRNRENKEKKKTANPCACFAPAAHSSLVLPWTNLSEKKKNIIIKYVN